VNQSSSSLKEGVKPKMNFIKHIRESAWEKEVEIDCRKSFYQNSCFQYM